LRNSSGSLAIFAAILRALGAGNKLLTPGVVRGRRSGDRHEAVAIHSRNFRRHALHRRTRWGELVRLLQLRARWLHKLRVQDTPTVLGLRARGWWVLRA